MSLDWLGWAGLTPREQMAGIAFGALFGAAALVALMAAHSLFSGLRLKRAKAKKKKRKKAKAKAKAKVGGRR